MRNGDRASRFRFCGGQSEEKRYIVHRLAECKLYQHLAAFRKGQQKCERVPSPICGLEVDGMCRNIKTLFNFEPPATEEEILAASLQFVRKISGINKPSRANEAAFNAAVDDIASISAGLLNSLQSSAAPKNRQEEEARAKARAAQRFGRAQ